MPKRTRQAKRSIDFFSDYDGSWKAGFKKHLRLNLEVFFPGVAAIIDWTVPPVWKDKEIERIINQPGKKNRPVDLLVELRMKNGESLRILVHIEVQSSKDESLPERLHLYNAGVFYTYGVRVITLAVLADLNPNWCPAEDLWQVGDDFESKLRFPTCKLIEKLDTDWKGVHSLPVEVARAQIAALRTAGDPIGRYRAKKDLILSLYEGGYTANDVREIYWLVDHMMQLREDLSLQFRGELIEFEESKTMPYVTSIERHGIETGRVEGRSEGREASLKILTNMLDRVFSGVPPKVAKRLSKLALDELLELGEKAMDMGSMDDVVAWLDSREQAG